MIKFTASFGDHDKQVEIVNHFGGGGSYYIYIDRFVYGTISYQHGEWRIYLNDSANADITTDDRMILIDMVIQDQLIV